jgi:hypothetical protein
MIVEIVNHSLHVVMESVMALKTVPHVPMIVVVVLHHLTQYVAMECVIQMKIVTHVLQIVLDHVRALMEKCAMILMCVCHTMYIVNQNFQVRIGMVQHVSARLST